MLQRRATADEKHRENLNTTAPFCHADGAAAAAVAEI